jgi:hypothetical protein
MIAAIVGAGEIGASIASTLTVRDQLREVRLIDDAGSVASGKALDIRQAAPVRGTDVRITGTTAIDAVAEADVIGLADACSPPREWQGEPALALLRRIAALNGRAPIVLAGAAQGWLLERAVAELRMRPERIVGTAPMALHAAVRGLVAAEAAVSPRVVALALAGRPPDHLVVAWEGATIAGAPLGGRLDAAAMSRLTRRLRYLWPPGPIALGVAAALAIEGLAVGSRRPVAALVAGQGPDDGPLRGQADGRAAIASVELEIGRLGAVHLAALSAFEQVALDNALGARR